MNEHPMLKQLRWLLDEPEVHEIESSFFSRLEADESRSAHDRLTEAVERRQFENPDETYEQAMFSVMRMMPNTAREYTAIIIQ